MTQRAKADEADGILRGLSGGLSGGVNEIERRIPRIDLSHVSLYGVGALMRWVQ